MYIKITVPATLNLRSSDECHAFIGEQINNINDNLVVVEFVNESGNILDYSGFLDAAVVGCTDTRWQDCAKKIQILSWQGNRYVWTQQGRSDINLKNAPGRFPGFLISTPHKSNMNNQDYFGEDFVGQDLSGKDLSNSSFACGELRGANLSGVDAKFTSFKYADLSNANLSNADLRGADFRYTNLVNADLRDANLAYANLKEADLTGANLTGANFDGANLFNATIDITNITNYFGEPK